MNNSSGNFKKLFKLNICIIVVVLAITIFFTFAMILNKRFDKQSVTSSLSNLSTNSTQSQSPATSTPKIKKYDGVTNYADLTHDGIDEAIVLDVINETVKVYDNNDNIIWTEKFNMSKGLYLYSKNDFNYLMIWNPKSFMYNVFSLSPTGEEIPLDKKSANFNYPPKSSSDNGFDEVYKFYEEAEKYFSKSIVLYDYNDFGRKIYSRENEPVVNTELIEYLNQVQDDKMYSFYADVTHDGVNEEIVVDLRFYREMGFYYVNVFDGKTKKLIWSDDAGRSHPTWNGIYLYKKNDSYYLMNWYPSAYTGLARFSFEVFSISAGGEVKILDKREVSFDIPFSDKSPNAISEVLDFCTVSNNYLKDSIILLDTDDGELIYSTSKKLKINTKYTENWYRETLGID